MVVRINCKLLPPEVFVVINSAILFINSYFFTPMQPSFEIKCIQGDSVTWDNDLKESNAGWYLPSCSGYRCYGGWGEMNFQFALRPKFSIWCSRYSTSKRRDFIARSKEALLEFSLQMDHPVIYQALPFDHQIVRNSQFNLFYLPYMESRAEFEVGQLTTTLDIHCTFAYLETLAEYFPDIAIPFLDRVAAGVATLIFPEPLYATGFMLHAARNILNLLSVHPANDYLLELNVRTLLSYALTCRYELNTKNKRISLEQISRIYAIRNRLDSDFSKVPDLLSLAREARMSLTAFKTLFKKEFRIPPYHYWMENRMNEARNQLINTNKSVSSIALDLAFPDAANFSKAFKGHFRFKPTDLRQ
ncbi:MAG: AraC family transcriptional regulator [Niabella sp.]